MRIAALFLLLVPIAEIAMFVVVGREIGVLGTLGLLIGAGVLGALVLRWQGLRLVAAARADLAAGRMPAETIVHGALLALAGLFLLLPGFLSDIAAFLLLLPPVRGLVVSGVRRNITVVSQGARTTASWTSSRAGSGVLDLEADEYERRGGGHSPWSGEDGPPRIGGA
ncbi:FxsA family protein [Chthonobacter rhizosphaerae]|uniref:FxsA family protein n=1 Tax=Chthonobacter rhizosphaerae TaxID=2735553 RepID=UPI0015EE52EA|nr:FxsA family protein [Chthonobacter rhizosphaerae]